MPSFKTIALCLAFALATATASTAADAVAVTPAVSRNLRAQHQTDTPHNEIGSDAVQNVNVQPGASTTNVNVTPGTVNTNVNITPGTSTTTISGVAAPAPPPPAPQPMAAPMAAPAPAPKPASGGGLDFGSLLGGGGSPLSGVATMAHVAHGALLGHTGSVPSSYMQGGGH